MTFDFIDPKVRKLNEAGDGVNIASAGIFRSFCWQEQVQELAAALYGVSRSYNAERS
jgi:hypothetical protein